ncbi:MAG: hypothetical protein GY757_00170 [bacterium]|nr:hypothetical protein [bacterium]
MTKKPLTYPIVFTFPQVSNKELTIREKKHCIESTQLLRMPSAVGEWLFVIGYWEKKKHPASGIQYPASSHHRFFSTTSIVLLASLLLTKSLRNITFIYYGTAIWIFMNKMI